VQANKLDLFIESTRYGQWVYLSFTGGLVFVGISILIASFWAFHGMEGLSDLTKLGGGFITALSTFPVKEFLARRDRVIALLAIKNQLEISNNSPGREDEVAKLTDIVWKVYEKGATGG
jgi:hypothetical protein